MKRVNSILNNTTFREYVRIIENNEIDRRFCKHGMEHFLDVARIGYILCLEENVEISKDVIYAAALLHDIGRAGDDKSGKKHHELSAVYAKDILGETDYSETEIEEIINAIMIHNSKTAEKTGLSYILFKADKLSRNCFDCKMYDECYWPVEQKNMGIKI